MRQSIVGFFSALILISAFVGCGSDPATEIVRNSNRTNIQRVTNLYSRYQLEHQWRGPANAKAFREFIPTLQPQLLELIGVNPSDLDNLFKSERDSEPFDITYGVVTNSQGTDDPIVSEKTGVDGVRQVGFTSLAIREFSSDKELTAFKAGVNAERKAANSSLPRGVAGR
jgi:hypothetical protein